MEEVVIVGAGVAGLACMNAFLDRGVQPLLFEAGTIGSYKLCGEFLTASACRQLEAWNIGPIQKIDQIHIDSLTLQCHSGALSRSQAELQLAQRAKNLGGRIVEQTKIEQALPGKVLLSNGTAICTKKLVIATGRFANKPTHFPYIGLKAHFEHEQLIPQLTMHLFAGGYYGIIPISATVSNIACLVKKEHLHNFPVKNIKWQSAPVGGFGLKKMPDWPNTYWIGDAIAIFPPATGQGFSHAIDSALLAANSSNYRREPHEQIRYKMMLSQCIHQLMLRPTAARAVIPLVRRFQNALCTSLTL